MRKQLTFVIALVVLITGTAAGQSRPDPLVAATDDPLELQQLAVQYIAGNRPREALGALSKALAIYPKNAESHMWRGVALTQLEDFEAAETEFRTALEMNPQLTEAHNWLGVHWARRGDLDRALEQYRLALGDPAYPRISRARVLANMGNALIAQGDVEAAVPALSEASRVSMPSNDPLFFLINVSLAEALLKSGRPEETLAVLKKLEVLPPDAQATYIAGLAHRDLGDVDKARDRLQQVLRLAPGTELANRALETLRQLLPGSGGPR